LGGCVDYKQVPLQAFDATILSVVNFDSIQDQGVFNTFPLYDPQLALIYIPGTTSINSILPANVSDLPATKSDLLFDDQYQSRLRLAYSYFMCESEYMPGVRPHMLSRCPYPNINSFVAHLFEVDIRRFQTIVAQAWDVIYTETNFTPGDYVQGFMAFSAYCYSVLYSRISKNQIFMAGPQFNQIGADYPGYLIPAFSPSWKSVIVPPIIADYISSIGPYAYHHELRIPVINMFPYTTLPTTNLTIYNVFRTASLVAPAQNFPSVLFVNALITTTPPSSTVYNGTDIAPFLAPNNNNLMTLINTTSSIENYFGKQTLNVNNSWIPIKATFLGEESLAAPVLVTSQTGGQTFVTVRTSMQLNTYFITSFINSFLPVSGIALGRALIYMFKVNEIAEVTNDGSSPYPYNSMANVSQVYVAIVAYGSNSTNDSALNKIIQANKGFVKFKRQKDINGHVISGQQTGVILVDIARREINEQINQGLGQVLNTTTVRWSKAELRQLTFDASFQGSFEFFTNMLNKVAGGVKNAVSSVYKLSGPLGPMALNLANQYTGGVAGAVLGSVLN